MLRLPIVLGLGVAVPLVAATAGAVYLGNQLEPAQPGSTQPIAFTVEDGSGLRQIAEALEAAGIIRNADAAVLVARLRGWGSSLPARPKTAGDNRQSCLRGRGRHAGPFFYAYDRHEVRGQMGERGWSDPWWRVFVC